MRSSAEILFRLRQEVANLRLLFAPPRLPAAGTHRLRPLLPEPAVVASRLHSTRYAATLGELAAMIRAGRVPLLGYELEYSHPIASPVSWPCTGSRRHAMGCLYSNS